MCDISILVPPPVVLAECFRSVAGVLRAGIFLGIVLAAAGCVSAPYYQRPVDLAVQTTDTTNQQMPVAVEVVYVYEPALVDTLSSLSAAEWFRKRRALAWRHPQGFERWRWEWAPGQSVPPRRLTADHRAQAAFVFAGYRSPGAHRDRVPPYRTLELTLNRTDFQVRPRR